MKNLQRVPVWPSGLRLAHGLIGLSVLVLIPTGWLIDRAPAVADAAADTHQLAGFALSAGLALRLYLLFAGSGAAHWRALVPARGDPGKAGMMLRFYLSLGRSPLPRWYAHNPLWVPLYALLLVILVLETATGLLMNTWPVLAGFYLPSAHTFWAPVILAFSAAHIVTAIAQDAKATTSDVSAMINGHRIFVVEPLDKPVGEDIQSIPLDQIRKRR